MWLIGPRDSVHIGMKAKSRSKQWLSTSSASVSHKDRHVHRILTNEETENFMQGYWNRYKINIVLCGF